MLVDCPLNNPLGQTMIANFCYHEHYDLDFYILTFLPLDAQRIMPLRQEIRYSVWIY